jgi:hypothetical protein
MTRAFSTLFPAHDIFVAPLAPCPISLKSLRDLFGSPICRAVKQEFDISRAA